MRNFAFSLIHTIMPMGKRFQATVSKLPNWEDQSEKRNTNEKVADISGAISDRNMRGLKQRKGADGVNKKERKSSSIASAAAAAAPSKDKGEDKSSNGVGATSTTSTGTLMKPDLISAANNNPVSSVSTAPVPNVLRANGKRVRRKHDPNAWSASTPSIRTNVLCLGVSYPSVKHQLLAEQIDPRVLHYSDEGVEQTVELVQRNILTEMDGRDLVRCLAMEQGDDTRAYCVSLENGARYGLRHLHANFNRVKFIAQMKKNWGRVKFRQIILDYFWIPRGTWVMSHWSRSFFDTILPSFVTEGMIDFSCGTSSDVEASSRKINARLQTHSTSGSGGGVVYLPFCLHCVKEVTAAINILSRYYTISFLHKSELSEHALWSATNSIDSSVMQRQFGKAIAQEEIYCTFKPQEAYSAADDAHISKKEVIRVLRRIEDFEDIRMMKLTALRKFDPEYRGSKASGIVGITKGGYVGLKDPSEVVRGFDHVGKAPKKPSKATAARGTTKAQPAAVPVPVPEVPASITDGAKKAMKRKIAPAESAKPPVAKKGAVKAKAKTAKDEVVKKPRAKKMRAEKKKSEAAKCEIKTTASIPSDSNKGNGGKKSAPKRSKAKEKKVHQSHISMSVAVDDMAAVTPSVGTSKQKSQASVMKSPRASSGGLGLVTPSPVQAESTSQPSSEPNVEPAEAEIVSQALTMPSPSTSIVEGALVDDGSSASSCPSLKSSPDVSDDDSSEAEVEVSGPVLCTPTKNKAALARDGGRGTKAAGKRKRAERFPSSLECLSTDKRFRPRHPLKKGKHAKRIESVLETAGVGGEQKSAPRRSPRKFNAKSEGSTHQTPVLRRSPRKWKDDHASILYPPVSAPFPSGDVLASVGLPDSFPTKDQYRRAPRKMWKQRAQIASAEKRKLQDRVIDEARVRMMADFGRTATSVSHDESTLI